MFSRRWSTSERAHEVLVERDVKVRMPDGTALDGNVYRPASPGRFPVILGAHPYNKDLQSPPLRPVGFTPMRGYMESGDSAFFARRGYVHAVFNVRGTGQSGGFYQLGGPLEVQDICHLVGWLAEQGWSSGKVGMFGVSYFARLAKAVAAAGPAALKAVFAPFAGTDDYRHRWYHGGILAHGFLAHWRNSAHQPRYRSLYREAHGEERYRQAIAAAMRDEEIMMQPPLREALQNPDAGTNAVIVDVLLHPLDGPFWRERSAQYEKAAIPAYLGACWGIYGLHLPGAFTAWKDWKGPKKMVIGPPVYLDRPVYQYQEEALRWFDYWLKGNDTGVMDEPPVRCFIPCLFATPPLVENTEILGPAVATLHLSADDAEALVFVTVLAIDREAKELELTRGCLRASQRRVREAAEPWDPVLAHEERAPLEPGKVYELRIPIVPSARLFRAGERIAIRVKGADDEPAQTSLQAIARNHLRRPRPVRITVYCDETRPSRVDLPITRGNVIGTFFSGGDISSFGLSR